MSRIVFMRGREWWLSKTRKNGREVYPDAILVGKLNRERRYIPCRWSMDDHDFAEALKGLAAIGDRESIHLSTDAMLSAFLRSVGYDETASAYDHLR